MDMRWIVGLWGVIMLGAFVAMGLEQCTEDRPVVECLRMGGKPAECAALRAKP